jgi:hypothetical protein
MRAPTPNPETIKMTDDRSWVLVPREPGTCELDDSIWLLEFMRVLHAKVEGHPIMGWSDFDDEQRERIKAAYRAMLSASPAHPKGEEGGSSSNASRAAMGPLPHVAPEAEPSGAKPSGEYGA